jgi:hypothetical protein
MKTFSRHLYDSFLRVNGWVLGGLALIFSIAVFFFRPEDKVAVGWLIATIAAALVMLAITVDAAHCGWRASRRGLPDVRKTLDPPATYRGIERILIVDPSDLFAVDAVVSVYAKEDEYERLIGIGRVLTIQTNGYLQIGISTLTESSAAITKKLSGNDASFLKTLIVKPSVPSYLLQEK